MLGTYPGIKVTRLKLVILREFLTVATARPLHHFDICPRSMILLPLPKLCRRPEEWRRHDASSLLSASRIYMCTGRYPFLPRKCRELAPLLYVVARDATEENIAKSEGLHVPDDTLNKAQADMIARCAIFDGKYLRKLSELSYDPH